MWVCECTSSDGRSEVKLISRSLGYFAGQIRKPRGLLLKREDEHECRCLS
jgi:hypothetical protein